MVLTWENLIQTVCLITGYSQQAYVAFYLGNFFYLIAVKIIFRLFLKILIFDFQKVCSSFGEPCKLYFGIFDNPNHRSSR